MSENFNEKDPFYQQGKRHQDQAFDRTMQQLHQAGSLEQLAQQRLWFLLFVTLPRRLWQYSPLSIFLFVIPLALYVIASIGITSGLNNFDSNIIAAIGHLIFGTVCLALMFFSIYWGFRKAVGLNRIIAISQMVLVALFTILAIVRTIVQSFQIRTFSPGSSADGLSFLMFLLFAGMVVLDVRRALVNRRRME
jgi:hypothetical protein